jgi:oligopeptide transport system substrate-binding protein
VPRRPARFALLALLLAACSSNGGGESAKTGEAKQPAKPAPESKAAPADETKFETGSDTWVFAISGEPETLDIGKMRGVNEFFIAMNLFEGLVEYPKGEGPMVPAAAEKWTVSDDGLTYTFTLRQGLKWTNGDPVTAEDFRYSWLRVLDPATASPYAEQLWIVQGGRAFSEGSNKNPDSVAVKALDPRTLQVKLEYVAPYFLELCAFQTYRPVHRKTVEQFGDQWTRPEHMVSNGPFKLSAWVPNDKLVLEKDPSYWDAANVKLNKVVVLPIQENTTAVNLYESGKLDWTGAVDLPAIQMASLAHRKDYHEEPKLGSYFYRVNVTRKPFDNIQVRKALSLAIDRDAVVKVIKNGFTPAASYVPKMPGYEPVKSGLDFDPEKARKVLAEAGYPDGKDFPTVRILYNTEQNHKKVAEMIQQMWSRNLGIHVELVNQEWKVYLKSQQDLDYDVSRSGWIGDYHDPMTFLDIFTSGNGNNNTGWADKEYDGLLEKARHEPDAQKRTALLTQAETILMDRGPVVPIEFYASAFLLNPAVKGFEPQALDLHPAKYISK